VNVSIFQVLQVYDSLFGIELSTLISLEVPKGRLNPNC